MNQEINEPPLPAVPPGTRGAVLYVRVSGQGQLGRDGSEDGYSLDAQVKACQKKADDLGLMVVKVYVERAESAKSDRRPVLQQMWKELPTLGVDVLIVHKVDRFARNRGDDIDMYRQLVAWRIELVSATENIDATPAGRLMHGILASLAEFYSVNLATEVRKGLHEKHAQGGTPFRPPTGYTPHRVFDGATDIRSVVLDEERAPLVKMMFDLYVTGDWPLAHLTEHMATLGLTSRPTPKRPAKPHGVSAIHGLLTNPYFTGVVVYCGKRVVGRHEPIVSMEQFNQVQVMLAANRQGDRAYKHEHYLRGTVVCAECGGRLLFGRHRSRSGDYYDYYSCTNRASRARSDMACSSAHYSVSDIEVAVERVWRDLALPKDEIDGIRKLAHQYRDEQLAVARKEGVRLDREIAGLEDQQRKLVKLYMEDLIQPAVLRKEQDEIQAKTEAAKALAAMADELSEDLLGVLELTLELLADPLAVYLRCKPLQMRALNRVFWKEIQIGEDDDVHPVPSRTAAAFAAAGRVSVASAPQLSSVDGGFDLGPRLSTDCE